MTPDRLAAVVAEAGVSHRSKPGSFVFDCPKCGKADRVWMRRRDGRTRCWSCPPGPGSLGRTSGPEWALSVLTGRSVEEIRVELGETPTAPILVGGLGEDPDIAPTQLEEIEWPYHYVGLTDDQAEDGRAYLLGRRRKDGTPAPVDPVVATKYGCRYSLRDRAVGVPVVVDGCLVAYQARTIDPHAKLRYKTEGAAPGCLMFQDRLQGSDHAVIAEGGFDAMAFDLAGGNVAGMGKSLTRQQVLTACSYGVRTVYFAVDPDAEAELDRLLSYLPAGVGGAPVLTPRGYKDPGELPPVLAAELVRGAQVAVRGTRLYGRIG